MIISDFFIVTILPNRNWWSMDKCYRCDYDSYEDRPHNPTPFCYIKTSEEKPHPREYRGGVFTLY